MLQIACTNDNLFSSCEVCQLGKQIKLPFQKSDSFTTSPFDIIHSDIWTSPLTSISGFKYYVIFLDDFSHFLWVFPLRRKSEVFSKFLQFYKYVETQFNTKHCSVTMEVSIKTPTSRLSFTLMGCNFVFLALIHLNKMESQNVCSELSTTQSVAFFSKLISHPDIGLKLFTLQCIFLTSYLPRLFKIKSLSLFSSKSNRGMIT